MKVVRWFVGGWFSRIYLALVAAATAFASVPSWARFAGDGSGYSHPDILPTALSLPGSIPLYALIMMVGPAEDAAWLGPGGERWLWVACVAGGALVNVAALNGAVSVAKRVRAKRGLSSVTAA